MPSEIKIYGAIKLFDAVVGFTCDSEDAWRAMQAAFAGWPDAADPVASIYIVIRQDVLQDASDSESRRGRCFTFRRAGVAAEADGGSLRAICRYEPRALADGTAEEALQALALFLLCQASYVPIHASAAMLDNTAILFAGPSGSGKSTLALAARRAGLTVLSDDTVFVQPVPFRIWSFSSVIHLYPRDAPEEGGGMRFRAGRWKTSLAMPAGPNHADRALVCLLERHDKIDLTPICPDRVVAALTEQPEPGYEFYGARAKEAARQLAQGGAWRLRLSGDPAEAIALVTRELAAR